MLKSLSGYYHDKKISLVIRAGQHNWKPLRHAHTRIKFRYYEPNFDKPYYAFLYFSNAQTDVLPPQGQVAFWQGP